MEALKTTTSLAQRTSKGKSKQQEWAFDSFLFEKRFGSPLQLFADECDESDNDIVSDAQQNTEAIPVNTKLCDDVTPSPTHRITRPRYADKEAAEVFLNENLKRGWKWITDWDETPPVSFADIITDEGVLKSVYFNTENGLPLSVEDSVVAEPSAYEWPDTESTDTEMTRLQRMAKDYINSNYSMLYELINSVTAQQKPACIPAETLPEDRSCWNDICSMLSDMFFGISPVTVFCSGENIFVSLNTCDLFSDEEMEAFAQSLAE